MLCKQGYCSYDWRSDLSHHQDIPKVWVSFEANSCHANWQILLVTQRMNERKQRKEKGKIREINKACGSFYVDTYCILCVCVCVCVCESVYISLPKDHNNERGLYVCDLCGTEWQRSQTWSILYYDFPPQRIFRRKETPSSHEISISQTVRVTGCTIKSPRLWC